MRSGLRERLRKDTSAAHARLDDLLSNFSFQTEQGRSLFLEAQAAGYQNVLGMTFRPGSQVQSIARATFETTGKAYRARTTSGEPVDEDAGLYVLVGARLGMKLLARRWSAATSDPVPELLALPAPDPDWKEVQQRLASRPATGAAADRTVADAGRIFDEFFKAVVETTRRSKQAEA